MKFIILAALCCFVLVINAATVPLTDDEINSSSPTRQKRSPLLLTALGAAGLVGAGLVGAGIVGLAGAGLVGAKLGAKAGFATGALVGSAARGFAGGSYYYARNNEPGYTSRVYDPRDYEYRAMVRVRV